MKLLLIATVFGLITSTVYGALVALACLRFAGRRRRGCAAGFEPPVSLLKPLHGDEPELEAHIDSFFRQEYPEFEILFCARSDQDPGLAVARQVAARHPQVSVKFLSSGASPYANAKVWSLERMQSIAKHPILVVSDSDVSVAPDYLRAVVAPFADERVGLVTCLYRGVAQRSSAKSKSLSCWSKLEAVGMSIEMSSGVLVAEMLEGMKFALGPTMVVRRKCLESAGGFHALGQYHADDFILGNRLAANGHEVVLSTHVIDHHVLNASFSASVGHQVRWMKSTRFSRPKGHLGTALTYSLLYGLLAAGFAWALHRPELALFLFLWSVATRVLLAIAVGGLVVQESNLLWSVLLYPVRDLLGFFFWTISYFSNNVLWRGEVYQLLRDGMMRSRSGSGDREQQPVLTA